MESVQCAEYALYRGGRPLRSAGGGCLPSRYKESRYEEESVLLFSMYIEDAYSFSLQGTTFLSSRCIESRLLLNEEETLYEDERVFLFSI